MQLGMLIWGIDNEELVVATENENIFDFYIHEYLNKMRWWDDVAFVSFHLILCTAI